MPGIELSTLIITTTSRGLLGTLAQRHDIICSAHTVDKNRVKIQTKACLFAKPRNSYSATNKHLSILPGIHRPVSHWGLKSGLVIHRKTFYFRWTFGVKVRVLSDPGPPHPINNYKQIVPFTLC